MNICKAFHIFIFLLSQSMWVNLLANNNQIKYGEKHILVLHSYHQGLAWTDSISKGILSELGNIPDINLVFEYLDYKRNYNSDYEKALLNLYNEKAKQICFSAIIASDNYAFDFIKKYGNKYYPNVPIFFCGVNDLVESQLDSLPHFYGINETIDYLGNFKIMQEIFPNRKNVTVICDNTLTGKKIQNEFNKASAPFKTKLNFNLVSDISLNDLKNVISKLGDTDLIYLLVLNRDKNGEYISYSNGLKLIESNTNVPILGSWDFYVKGRFFGGKVTRGVDQGKYVAQLAYKHITNQDFTNTPRIANCKTSFIFNYLELKKYSIPISSLPKDSIIINKPKHNKMLLRFALITSSILFFCIILLIILLQIRKERALELEKIVNERTQELTKANRELTSLNENKNKFFSILAHDLRNKIGGVMAFSKLLNDDHKDFNSKTLKRIYRELMLSSCSTFNILEDTLYWGKKQLNESFQTNISEFNIVKVTKDIQNHYFINDNDVSIQIVGPPNLMIKSDEDILKFIIRNFVHNAIKFSYKEGVVTIKIQKQDSNTIISISDNGIGMSDEIIASIYKKKPIIKDGSSGNRGTGIGLPTVIDYLELIDGNLYISSEIGKGSTFCITI